jgi:hypothetical protein
LFKKSPTPTAISVKHTKIKVAISILKLFVTKVLV